MGFIPLKKQRIIIYEVMRNTIGMYFDVKTKKTSINRRNEMPSVEKDVVMTSGEAIEYLKISKPTFLKYVHHGKLRAIKAGKGWRILLSELNRFLKGEADA